MGFALSTSGNTGNVPTFTFIALCYVRTQVNSKVHDGFLGILGLELWKTTTYYPRSKTTLQAWVNGLMDTTRRIQILSYSKTFELV